MKEKSIYIALGGLLAVYVIIKYVRPSQQKIEEEKQSSYIWPAVQVLTLAGVALSLKNGIWTIKTDEGFSREKFNEVMSKNWEDIKKLPGYVVSALEGIRTGAEYIYKKGVELMPEKKGKEEFVSEN